MTILVTYDIKKAERDYKEFYEVLKKQGSWWHYISSTWLLDTEKAPEEVADAIRPYMDNSDSLFVVEITRNYSGFLSEKAWAWMHRHEK